MNQPLGQAVGNSLEVIESLNTLRGNGPRDFNYLCRELSAEMLLLGQAAATIEDARSRYDELISSGKALDKMREIIKAQHGDPRVVDDETLLPRARNQSEVKAERSGYIQSIDTEAVGRASMVLGAGRTQLNAPVDASVGIMVQARIGDMVDKDSPLATVHFNNHDLAAEAAQVIADAYVVGPDRVDAPELIKAVLR